MARMRDESKRTAILEVSKALFSKQGFSNTSISDIIRGTGFPVGTIYTYFKNKEEIVTVIAKAGELPAAHQAPGSPETPW
ncbi:MAG: helix-turn-helix transcriptional regulator [Spirochaetales bacterium]|nr:helix-turn-helix transcriptional regulator [Spirochaetales bacterium]